MVKVQFLAVFAILALAAACTDSNKKASTSTADPASTATAVATASPSPEASPTAPRPTPIGSGTLVPSTVQVIDMASGTATTLYESSTDAAYNPGFLGDVVTVFGAGRTQYFHLDGSTATAPSQSAPECQMKDGKAVVLGHEYPAEYCGTFSPDGRWMTYAQDAGTTAFPSGYEVPVWDQWVADVQTGGTRKLQAGLEHCGGCDGRYGPSWSPSSRYVAYAELGGGQRRFLSEVTTGATRVIGAGSEITLAPVWSPKGDLIAYSFPTQGTIARLEDLPAGTVSDLPIAWPVRFDASGRYLYSPAWNRDPKSGGGMTSIFDVAANKVVAQLSGSPPASALWTDSRAVGASTDGYVAALEGAEGCDGTAIYRDGVAAPDCIGSGAEGRVSPDGLSIAVAIAVGTTGPAYGPGFQATLEKYSVSLVPSAGGPVRTVVTGAASFVPPLMLWNGAGTHLLVMWPSSVGL